MKINVNTGIEETSGEIIALRDFANLLKLKIIYMNTARQITLQTVSVNRPGLILSGFDDYFARSRVQVLGNAEMYYLYQMTDENRRAALKKLFKTEVPCIIISRGLEPCKDMLDLAKEYDTPVLQSNAITSEVVNDIINFLNDFLAPKTRIHGTLLDIDGIGVLLTGISGVGKSETALELIHRGHMLVADDTRLLARQDSGLYRTSRRRIYQRQEHVRRCWHFKENQRRPCYRTCRIRKIAKL